MQEFKSYRNLSVISSVAKLNHVIILYHTLTECGNQTIYLKDDSSKQLEATLSLVTSCRWVIYAAPGQQVHAQFGESNLFFYVLHIGSLDYTHTQTIDFEALLDGIVSEVVSPNEVLVLTLEPLPSASRKKRQSPEISLNVTLESVDSVRKFKTMYLSYCTIKIGHFGQKGY